MLIELPIIWTQSFSPSQLAHIEKLSKLSKKFQFFSESNEKKNNKKKLFLFLVDIIQ